jgi:hypothetical protein
MSAGFAVILSSGSCEDTRWWHSEIRGAADREGAVKMHKYVIERTLPGAGNLTEDELRGIAQKSNEVLDAMAGRAQWIQSYVTDDKIYCVYIADSVETIGEHARAGGFPCDNATRVATIIDPTTADVAA